MDPDAIRKTYCLGADAPITDETRDEAIALMQSEVKVYDTYLRGDVWAYKLERSETCKCCKHVEWNEVESCSGIYNGDDMLDVLRDMVPEEAHHLIEQAWQDRE